MVNFLPPIFLGSGGWIRTDKHWAKRLVFSLLDALIFSKL